MYLIHSSLISKSTRTARYILGALIVLVACTQCREKEPEREVPIRPVKYATVQKTGVIEQHTFSGTAKAEEEARLSFRVAGTVTRIPIKVGDYVRQGQLIALLDPGDFTIQLKQVEAMEQGSKASEKSAEANYLAAKSAYQRISKLYENNSVSLSQFEQAKTQYDAAKSQYEAAKFSTSASHEQIHSAQNQVSYTQLKAPFSGVISSQHIEENELVNSGTPIVTLSSIGSAEVVVGVPEVLISKVQRNMETDIRFTTIENTLFKGRVEEVGFTPGQRSTYPVTIRLLTDHKDIRPGMPADVVFEFPLDEAHANLVLVPAGAIGEDNKGRFVFLLEQDGDRATAKKQYVEVGHLHNEGFEIRSGLSEGQLIATAGLNILLEGDVVRLN